MPAATKIASEQAGASLPDRVGILAGGGSLPERLLYACDKRDIHAFVIGFEGQTNPQLMIGRHHLWARLGAAGQIIKTLKAHEIKDIVMIGSVTRPAFSELRPDWKGMEILARMGLRSFGDDGLLQFLRDALEREGFTVHGIQRFADDLLAGKGPITRTRPSRKQEQDIARGIEVVRALGRIDVGQSCIVQEGIVLGVEAAEGTDALIQRTKYLQRKGSRPILIKMCKPDQDLDLDMPTIGPDTVTAAIDAGLGGIVVHAAHTLIIDPQDITQKADAHKIFVTALDPADYVSPEATP